MNLDRAITDTEYRELMAGRDRPLLDQPLGSTTASKRKADAECSAIVSESLGHHELWPGDNPSDTSAGANCGTDAGYKRHSRAGTSPCQPCKTAHAAYRQRRKAVQGDSRPTCNGSNPKEPTA